MPSQMLTVGSNLFDTMESTTIQALLLQLDFSQLWLDSGILTENILIEQLKELNAGQDNNPEHYRYRTLSNYFKTNPSFDDNLLQQILHILQSDPDKSMASSATILLLKKQTLTDEQFDIVANFLRHFGDWTTKQIDKERTRRTHLDLSAT